MAPTGKVEEEESGGSLDQRRKKAQSSVRKRRGESGRLEGLPKVAKRSSCWGDRQGTQRTRSYFRYW